MLKRYSKNILNDLLSLQSMNLLASHKPLVQALLQKRLQALCLPSLLPGTVSIYLYQNHSRLNPSSSTHPHHTKKTKSASLGKRGDDAAEYFS